MLVFPIQDNVRNANLTPSQELKDLLVKPLPTGCQLTVRIDDEQEIYILLPLLHQAVFDSCHSGTILG